jgi:lysine 6-dehydrogenase
MKITVLGSGLVGAPMALDLAKEKKFKVTVADIDDAALARLKRIPQITVIREDLSEAKAVRNIIKDSDLVISAVPGFMGYRTLQTVLEAKKNVVDIAFFPEDPFALDGLARRKGVIAIVDCGVAPGMSSILAADALRHLDKGQSISIYIGGLPQVREWPYEYKAVFSPYDVIEEYIRPARYVEHGRMVVRPALSDPEYLNFPGIGTLEAFNTDGLRTLARTLKVPNMKEKTLRYPGHIEKMTVLRETGFFDSQEVEIQGIKIRPIDFTAKILFPKWKLAKGEADITVMKIIVEGKKKSQNIRIIYNLLDSYDKVSGIHSMARTTGYTATMAARMIAQGLYTRKGISAPEYVGQKPKCVEFILQGLRRRSVIYRGSIESIE